MLGGGRQLCFWDSSSCCVGVLTLSRGTASQSVGLVVLFPVASCVRLCLWPGCGLVFISITVSLLFSCSLV